MENNKQLFNNPIDETKGLRQENEAVIDEKKEKGLLAFFKSIWREFFILQIILKHNTFNEEEAATYLRLSDPQGAGKQTVRYYALKAKKLSYMKIGRDGLIFTKTDLDNFIKNAKIESYREL